MLYNKEEIKGIIPHREPFLWVDEILEMDIEKGTVTGSKTFGPDEDFFKGHFPGEPVVPGVIQLEAMAQTGACLILSMETYKNKIAYFARINDVRFKNKVLPGDKVIVEVELLKLKSRMGTGKGIAKVGDEVVSQCEFTFMIGN